MRFRTLRPPSRTQSAALAILGPGAAVGLGIAIDRKSLVGATSLFLLAVLFATAFGGRRSGLAASVVGFLCLNFFFTPPYHTIRVQHPADLIALFVFLAVSVIVGALLSRALEERERAERRVAEARFLDRITARLISGERIEQVLGEFARDLVAMFELARCEIHVAGDQAAIAAPPDPADLEASTIGPRLEVPLGADPPLGTLVALRDRSAPEFGSVERSFLQDQNPRATFTCRKRGAHAGVARAGDNDVPLVRLRHSS